LNKSICRNVWIQITLIGEFALICVAGQTSRITTKKSVQCWHWTSQCQSRSNVAKYVLCWPHFDHICKSPLTVVVMKKSQKNFYWDGRSRFPCPSKDIWSSPQLCGGKRVVILDTEDLKPSSCTSLLTLNSTFRIDFKMFDF